VTSTPTETRHTELLPTQFAPVSSAVSEDRVSLPLPMAVVSGEFAPRHQLSFASQTIPQAAPQYTVPADELSSMLGRLAQQRLGSGATTTELILEPQELGRIRVTLTGGESGGQIAIIVERGETLDLVRRHVDLVRSDLRASGWEATEFSLSRESFGSSDNNNGDDNLRPDEPDDRQLESSDSSEDFEPGPDNRKPIDGGLDLRV
jgi:flagellar hook-length control protein FliK